MIISKRFIICILLGLVTLETTQAKVFQKCPLAKLLDSNQISRTLISNWICLVQAESGADTSKKTSLDNLSASYGIFQINSKEWCRVGRKGGKCNKDCEDFLTDDITDDIECAKQIYRDHGFSYWKGWTTKCKQNKRLPDISACWN